MVGSIGALTPTRSALRAALCAGYTAVPTAQYCPRDSAFRRCEAIIAEPFAERIIPPARVSVFFEDSFALKWFQRDGEVVGLGGSLHATCIGRISHLSLLGKINKNLIYYDASKNQIATNLLARKAKSHQEVKPNTISIPARTHKHICYILKNLSKIRINLVKLIIG